MIAQNTPSVRPQPEQGHWTYSDWEALPDDGCKYEVLDGVLFMTPPPTFDHQDAQDELLMRMRLYAKQQGLGKVVSSPIGVRLPNQPIPIQPDVVFVSKKRLHIITPKYIEGTPDLVVEILSPSTWTYDRKEKFEAYRAAGVPEYWIVDYRAKTIEIFKLEAAAYVLTGKFGPGQSAVSQELTGFSVPIDELFSN
jgi:Uma2 family endonuclease